MELEAYQEVRERLDHLLRSGDPDAPVPACPSWRVRDVTAHLAGLCEDWVDHRLEGYGSDHWTALQVSRFSGLRLEQVLDAWRDAMSRFALLDDDPRMGPPARWAFGDAVIHEADIRGALGSGHVPLDAVLLGLKGAIGRWREVLREARAETLFVRTPDARAWWLGVENDPNAVVVMAPVYEVFRALSGRRSERQVRGWDWTADPGPYLTAGLPYPFSWGSDDLVD
jgi:uncharacterized protein (TIGR03083 family)